MELRRLQRTADGTYFVTIPKPWVIRFGIDRGALLAFDEVEDGTLMLAVHGRADRKIKAAKLSPSSSLERQIEEKYLLGYDVIRVASDDMITSETRETVKQILKRLVGLEIVEEDAKALVMQCLIEPSLLVPEKVLRRLHLITTAMQNDAIAAFVKGEAKLANSVVQRDEEVDRLYFLVVRVIRAALTDLTLAQKLGTTPIDCLDHRLLASFIENFADYSVGIAVDAPKKPPPSNAEISMNAILGAGKVVDEMYKSAVEAVLTRKLEIATDIQRHHHEVTLQLRSVERSIHSLPAELIGKITSTVTSLKAMCEITIDIADLAVTH